MWFTPNTRRNCFVVFLFGPSRLRSKQSTWQRIQKKLLRADVLLFIAIFMYVGMTENFANKNEDVDIPSIYSTGNIVCDLKKEISFCWWAVIPTKSRFQLNETKTGGFSQPEIRIELTNIGILNSNSGGPKTISMGIIFQADMLRI